jgi:hypothetical protein
MAKSTGTHRGGGGHRATLNWSWLTALAGLFVATMGCGARSGLREERVTTAFTDWRVQTVCQCGYCKTVPWCVGPMGLTICDLGTATCPCNGVGQVPVTRGLTSINSDGSLSTLYCHGPANIARDDQQALIPFGGSTSSIISDPTNCLLTNDGFLRATGHSVAPGFNRAATCGASPYRCSTVLVGPFGATGNTLAFADELNCPKADADPDPSVFVPGTSAANAIQNARPLLGAMCNLWSHPRTTGSPVPGPGGASAHFHCFARSGPMAEQATPNAGMARFSGGVVITDPGHAFGGHDCYASQSYNYLRITRQSDGTTGTATLTGTGSAATSAEGMALTDFRLQQVGTTTYSGYNLSNVRVNLEDLWSGTPTTTSGVYTVPSLGARVQGQYTIGSSTYSLRLTAIADATMRWNGTWYTIDARFSSDDVGVLYDLHVELDLTRARPTAAVNPVGDVECTSPNGATVTVTGSLTGSSGETRSAWSVNTGSDVLLAAGGPSATFQLPLLTPWGPGLEPQLTVFDGMLTARASTPARVIDTAAPSITSSWIHVDCGWGSVEDNPYDPKYCVGVNGTTTDLCSSANVRTLLVTQYLSCNRSAIIRQDAKACVRPDPNHWGANISDIVYEMDYAPVDAWGNQGATTRVSFKVNPQPATSSCAYPRSVVMNPCGWGW